MHDTTTMLMASWGFFALVAITFIFFLRRTLSSPSRQIDQWHRQMEKGEIPAISQRTDFDYEIKCTDSGFSILPLRKFSDPVCHGDWISVRTVTAFKTDLITTDCVCLAFEFSNGLIIQAHEEMRNWLDLCKALPVHLPGTPPWEKWFMIITNPAFESRATLLYQAGL